MFSYRQIVVLQLTSIIPVNITFEPSTNSREPSRNERDR